MIFVRIMESHYGVLVIFLLLAFVPVKLFQELELFVFTDQRGCWDCLMKRFLFISLLYLMQGQIGFGLTTFVK
jgi:hypothetical protein